MNLSVSETCPTRLLKGCIQNLRKTRRNQDFFFTAADRSRMGKTAIAAGLSGLGGIATGLSGMAMDTTEEADLLEFELDGKPIRAWVWLSVFSEGDEVEVVGERVGDVWQGYGICRVVDRIVALHPHCSRGRYAHYKISAKMWIGITLLLGTVGSTLVTFMDLIKGDSRIISTFLFFLFFGTGALMLVTAFIAFRVSRKFMGFVELAEGIFESFGWCDVKNIDLPAITKKSKRPGDPAALGVLYFRYPK